MAETKTYKGKRGGYYGERHQASLGEYMVTPFDTTHGFDLQNAPGQGKRDQFGAREDEGRVANPPATK